MFVVWFWWLLQDTMSGRLHWFYGAWSVFPVRLQTKTPVDMGGKLPKHYLHFLEPLLHYTIFCDTLVTSHLPCFLRSLVPQTVWVLQFMPKSFIFLVSPVGTLHTILARIHCEDGRLIDSRIYKPDTIINISKLRSYVLNTMWSDSQLTFQLPPLKEVRQALLNAVKLREN